MTTPEPPEPKCPELLAESFIRRWDSSEAARLLAALDDRHAAERCVDALVGGFDDDLVTKSVQPQPVSAFEGGDDGSGTVALVQERERHLIGAAAVVRIHAPRALVLLPDHEKAELPLYRFLERMAEEYSRHGAHVRTVADSGCYGRLWVARCITRPPCV